jgi:hypothetical protein
MTTTTMTKSWKKFKRKAAFHGRVTRDFFAALRDGVKPSYAAKRVKDKYGLIILGGGTGLSALSGSMATGFSWNAQVALTGVNYTPSTNTGSINKRQAYGTTVGTNAQSGGCDEVFSFQQGITAGSSATLDLNGMTDLLQRVSPIVRIKGHQFRLLSATDDSTISPAPTSTSTAMVTNNGPTLPCQLDFTPGGSGLTLALTQTAGVITGVSIGAAGTGYPPSTVFVVAPVQSSGAGGIIAVTTNGSGVPTAVAIVFGGTGYTDATVPSVGIGYYTIYTGGAHAYFDPAAAGFSTVSATQKNVKLINLDGAHAVTFEVDVYGASS